MLLKRLSLRDFRNYEALELLPNPGINVLYGANAQGKTNVLEAIHLLSKRKSHRAERDLDMVRWGQSGYSAVGGFAHANLDFDISVTFDEEKGKTVRINGLSRRAAERLFPEVQTVLFVPDDLQMVKGPASMRRTFLDQQIAQVNSSYAYELSRYGKALSQRNSLLKEGASRQNPVLGAFTERLVSHGVNIYKKRLETLGKLVPEAREIHARISNGERLEVIYRPSIPLPRVAVDGDRESRESADSQIRDAFFARLKDREEQESARMVTLVGPHRDDLSFVVSGRDARAFGSQGQQRSVVVSMKISELGYIHRETGRYPILLLDDILSELDASRRDALLSSVNHGVQIFLTCTEYSGFASQLPGHAAFYEVKNGTVEPKANG